MKLVTAIIQPVMVPKLARVLRKQPVTGYTISRVEGSGSDPDPSPDYVKPKAKFEIAIPDHLMEQLIKLIVDTVSTHSEGDGIVFATTLDAFVNLQSGRRDDAAFVV